MKLMLIKFILKLQVKINMNEIFIKVMGYMWGPDQGSLVEEEFRWDELFWPNINRGILRKRMRLEKGWCQEKYLSVRANA